MHFKLNLLIWTIDYQKRRQMYVVRTNPLVEWIVGIHFVNCKKFWIKRFLLVLLCAYFLRHRSGKGSLDMQPSSHISDGRPPGSHHELPCDAKCVFHRRGGFGRAPWIGGIFCHSCHAYRCVRWTTRYYQFSQEVLIWPLCLFFFSSIHFVLMAYSKIIFSLESMTSF